MPADDGALLSRQSPISDGSETSNNHKDCSGITRRRFVETAAVASASVVSAVKAFGQSRQEAEDGRTPQYESDPGPENKVLFDLNPDANLPPFTDKGNPPPFWYSFALTAKRLQAGGWTHQVTEREIAQSKDLAGVNMRLTAGAFRELHWHLADEWAIMLTGKARVTVMQPNGKMFIDDVERGDLWYFPSGFPHSIQGLEGPGCEFLLVFDQGTFSEEDTFLLSETLAHIPLDVIQKNMGWTRQQWDQLPAEQLYIFPGRTSRPTRRRQAVPRRAAGDGEQVHLPRCHDDETAGGNGRRCRTRYRFDCVSGLQECCDGDRDAETWRAARTSLASERQRTAVLDQGKRADDDHPDWCPCTHGGFQRQRCGICAEHGASYIENTGNEDVIFLEMFKTSKYESISFNEWIGRMPDKMAQAHLKLPVSVIRKAPQNQHVVLPK